MLTIPEHYHKAISHPFTIYQDHSNARLSTAGYIELIKRYQLVWNVNDTDVYEHDLKFHFEVLPSYVKNDANFFDKLKVIIDQPGDEREKLIDYLTFEYTSFCLNNINNDNDPLLFYGSSDNILGYILMLSLNEETRKHYKFINLECSKTKSFIKSRLLLNMHRLNIQCPKMREYLIYRNM